MTDTQTLIAELAARGAPVRPLGSPLRRTLRWIAIAIAVMAVAVLFLGLRPGVVDALSGPAAVMEWFAPMATGVLAAYAAFEVSVPGRSPRWAWLPVPALAAWLGSIGLGCLADIERIGAGAFASDTHGPMCLITITLFGVPLLMVMLVMVRHAAVVRPRITVVLGALSAAALSTAGIGLTHGGETAWTVLLWHIGAVLLLALVTTAFRRLLFALTGYGRTG
jgi:hypothetical protein